MHRLVTQWTVPTHVGPRSDPGPTYSGTVQCLPILYRPSSTPDCATCCVSPWHEMGSQNHAAWCKMNNIWHSSVTHRVTSDPLHDDNVYSSCMDYGCLLAICIHSCWHASVTSSPEHMLQACKQVRLLLISVSEAPFSCNQWLM